MERRIEWNPNHRDSDEQELEFRMSFITWSAEKKWEYIMELFRMNDSNINHNSKRRIEW